ncbi:hypothetical protein [Bradyrhizobium liaoningense]|uniref:hypothetical protein n=1 Tax=Bradyrhizobium liaoningense TaxID=43992 RepID=UPI0028A1A4EE|nr:hypothetical protein [Bradyrhizobium liaoningense]
MNLPVTVLKILVSYPDGFALMAELKRDMAILATSGPEWTERTKRLTSRMPNLDIFSNGSSSEQASWRITDNGRAALELMEARRPLRIRRSENAWSAAPNPQRLRCRYRLRGAGVGADTVSVDAPPGRSTVERS